MKCAVLEDVGKPLVVRELEDPSPVAGEVLVALRAAALNHRDLWIQKGQYAGIRCPLTTGSDGAGVVMALGEGVDPFWQDREVIINPGFYWGDRPEAQSPSFEILGLPRQGTHATHIVVPADRLAPRPAHLSWAESAALPLAGVTAFRALFTKGACTARTSVLITGIGGGVALSALQFAAATGATVAVTSSSETKRKAALDLGASFAFDYTNPDWTRIAGKECGGFDLVVDGAGGDGLAAVLAICEPGARIVIYGATAGLAEGLDLRKIFWKQLQVIGTTMGTDAEFVAMIELVERHGIQPMVDCAFPLGQINDAFQHMEQGAQLGKIVITMEDSV